MYIGRRRTRRDRIELNDDTHVVDKLSSSSSSSSCSVSRLPSYVEEASAPPTPSTDVDYEEEDGDDEEEYPHQLMELVFDRTSAEPLASLDELLSTPLLQPVACSVATCLNQQSTCTDISRSECRLVFICHKIRQKHDVTTAT